ncbi:trypsin-like serine protease [Fructobacillus sp. M2-14]|uniref:Trypsin-like serine protease n=1 Tax=Fructobacillus broussonetiae TaxID=2713173 RepID=A0ABS5R074_9LACO|nr:trypsin-like peptidase domain-containing protein [Fructobacillus broussonetiae]MBS9338026.1 trypsin-like serine protease [Fructobacillus broussonetiae]
MKKLRMLQVGLAALTFTGSAVTVVNPASAFVFDPVKFQKGRVPNTRMAPFSSIVFIVDEETGETGSGVLIAPDTVLTAAHVVMRNRAPSARSGGSSLWPRQLINPSSLHIRPAYGGNTGSDFERYPFGWNHHGESVSIRADYFQEALRPGGDSGDNDIALIHLNAPIEGAPVLPLGEFRRQDLDRRELVTAIGFPAFLGGGNQGMPFNHNDSMYVDSGTIDAMTGRQLLSRNLNWTNGDSGGPIINSRNQVVGIMSASNSYGSFATRIDSELTCWIRQQMASRSEALAPHLVSHRWRQLGNRRVYFDEYGVATMITAQGSADEPMDLSLPKKNNHTEL